MIALREIRRLLVALVLTQSRRSHLVHAGDAVACTTAGAVTTDQSAINPAPIPAAAEQFSAWRNRSCEGR